MLIRVSEGNKSDGNSNYLTMSTRAGTAFYMAPEVIRKDYDHLCDMWSAGVILYVLLSGYPPFYGENDKEILDAVVEGFYDFDDDVWENISEDAKLMIRRIICPRETRLSAK
jgi:calcium-dependent protein kinase